MAKKKWLGMAGLIDSQKSEGLTYGEVIELVQHHNAILDELARLVFALNSILPKTQTSLRVDEIKYKVWVHNSGHAWLHGFSDTMAEPMTYAYVSVGFYCDKETGKFATLTESTLGHRNWQLRQRKSQ